MTELLVRLEIPISPHITFTQWLPLSDEDAIVVSEDDLSLKLWFDDQCNPFLSKKEIEEGKLNNFLNPSLVKVYADINAKNVSTKLISYIQNIASNNQDTSDKKRKISDDYNQLKLQYSNLAWSLLSLTLRTLNRLISYIKSQWGQYWLQEYDIDRNSMPSRYSDFKGRATTNGVDWFDFGSKYGSTIGSILKVRTLSKQQVITHDDWSKIQEYVLSSKKPPLVRSLLAGAEALADNGYDRSAIIELVVALEIALNEFAANPKLDSVLAPKYQKRLGIKTLKKQVEKFGLTGSISYLLPLILPDSLLSDTLIKECREAVNQRNNVVHQGQRDVRNEVLRLSLKAVRQLCELLETLTVNPESLLNEDTLISDNNEGVG